MVMTAVAVAIEVLLVLALVLALEHAVWVRDAILAMLTILGGEKKQ
jgi:hypothetical protein